MGYVSSQEKNTFLNGDFIGAEICHDLSCFFIYTYTNLYKFIDIVRKAPALPWKEDKFPSTGIAQVPITLIEQNAMFFHANHNLWTTLGMLLANCPPWNSCMKPKNKPLEKEIPFLESHQFSGFTLNFGGVLPQKKRTWQWKIHHHLKMYHLLMKKWWFFSCDFFWGGVCVISAFFLNPTSPDFPLQVAVRNQI